METSEPEEKAQHKFDGILLCSMGLNIDKKFKVLKTSGSWVVLDTVFLSFCPENL